MGEDLTEGAGIIYLGVAGVSYTGPSYIPRETPCFLITFQTTVNKRFGVTKT